MTDNQRLGFWLTLMFATFISIVIAVGVVGSA